MKKLLIAMLVVMMTFGASLSVSTVSAQVGPGTNEPQGLIYTRYFNKDDLSSNNYGYFVSCDGGYLYYSIHVDGNYKFDNTSKQLTSYTFENKSVSIVCGEGPAMGSVSISSSSVYTSGTSVYARIVVRVSWRGYTGQSFTHNIYLGQMS